MRIKYHRLQGVPIDKQDPLPENWRELSKIANGKPEKFGVVEPNKLYRSAVVWPRQVEDLYEDYGVCNIITLIDGDWLKQFYDDERITIHQFPFFRRRELTFEKIKDVVKVINLQDKPSLVCCLKGVVRTGMLVAGYEILNGRKSNLRAMVESVIYGNVNISSFREMRKYHK